MDSQTRSSIADSPWYWVLVFSLMAIAALVAMRAKYDTRQAGIERQYQARERVAERINAENNPQAASRIDDKASRRAYSTPDEHLIPLWPLAIFFRTHRHAGGRDAHSREPREPGRPRPR